MAQVSPSLPFNGNPIPCVIHRSVKKQLEEEVPKLFIGKLSSLDMTGKLYLVGDDDLDSIIGQIIDVSPSSLPKAIVLYDHDNDFPSRVVASILKVDGRPKIPLVLLPSPANGLSIGHQYGTHTFADAALALKDGGGGEPKEVDVQLLTDYRNPSSATTRCCLHSLGVGEISVRKSFGFFSSLFSSSKIKFEIQIEISDYDYDTMVRQKRTTPHWELVRWG